MASLKKLEPVAFVLLFIALSYALFAVALDSALHDFSKAETLAGWVTVVVAVALVLLRRLPERRLRVERSIYAVFLAAMPFRTPSAAPPSPLSRKPLGTALWTVASTVRRSSRRRERHV